MEINVIYLNAILFNAFWLLSVVGGSLWALLCLPFYLFIHCYYVAKTNQDLKFVAIVFVIGFFVESVFLYLGILENGNGSVIPPLWLLCLWCAFATTLNYSFSWFYRHRIFAALAGAISLPLTYFTGARLSSMNIGEPLINHLIVLGVVWAILFPVLLQFAHVFNQSVPRKV